MFHPSTTMAKIVTGIALGYLALLSVGFVFRPFLNDDLRWVGHLLMIGGGFVAGWLSASIFVYENTKSQTGGTDYEAELNEKDRQLRETSLQLLEMAGQLQRLNQNKKHNTETNPYVEIQAAAFAQFFPPDRDRDPKKDEVVEWINAKLKDAGLGASNNIAAAMFTIIKPTDHDPKRRRDEPKG